MSGKGFMLSLEAILPLALLDGVRLIAPGGPGEICTMNLLYSGPRVLTKPSVPVYHSVY